jgi:hypothetical protein
MKQHECQHSYPISIESQQVGIAKPGDVFLTDLEPTDKLNAPALFNRRCWLLTDTPEQAERARAAHFIELGEFVWFRNCTSTH